MRSEIGDERSGKCVSVHCFQYFSSVVFFGFVISFIFYILFSVFFIFCIFQSLGVFHFLKLKTSKLETIEMAMTTNIALNVTIVTILFLANINVLDTTKINNIIYR